MKKWERIQMVLNTLEQLEIRGSYDNTSKLLGIYQELIAVRDGLQAEENKEEVTENGGSDGVPV